MSGPENRTGRGDRQGGALLRAAREEAGLTQPQLGKAIGVGKSSISRYESGRQNPTLSSVRQMAEALGLSFFEPRPRRSMLEGLVPHERKILEDMADALRKGAASMEKMAEPEPEHAHVRLVTAEMAAAGDPEKIRYPAQGELGLPICIPPSVVKNPAATFCVEVRGDSMISPRKGGVSIRPGSYAVVDTSEDDAMRLDGRIVAAVVPEKGLVIKKLKAGTRVLRLQSLNPKHPDTRLELKTLEYNPIIGLVVAAVWEDGTVIFTDP